MASNIFTRLFGEKEEKSVITVSALQETTRDGFNKSYIPKYLYKPPFGFPRYANLSYIRWLATTPYVEMCISTILDELCAVDWEIVICPGEEDKYVNESGEISEQKQEQIEHIKDFLTNPNSNNESFEDVFIRMAVRDILEVNAGVLNKVYNLKGELVEVVARDGATFTKNPDLHGMYSDRADIILPEQIVETSKDVYNPYTQIPAMEAREQAAYFQYGWTTGPSPVPFGRREIIWLERMKRTDDFYAYSPIQILNKSLQMLMYMIDSDLEYYNNNNVPKGIIGFEQGTDSDTIEAFQQQLNNQQRIVDEFGNYKKLMHKVPVMNSIPKFERIQFSSSEMQIIEKQKWYTKMVWAAFGVTPTELGYTDDASGQANQIVQSKVFRKKAINPILQLLEEAINNQIIPEFEYEDLEFSFLLFDIDEERNKYELYQLQSESGIKTINEIRHEEGLDPVDWGDQPPNQWKSQDSSINFYNDTEREAQETDEARKVPQPRNDQTNVARETEKEIRDKSIETKPFGKYSSFEDCVRKNHDKEDPEAYCAQIEKNITGKYPGEKATNTESPLILGENERPSSPDRLTEAITYMFQIDEEEIKKWLEIEFKPIREKKGINEFVGRVKDFINGDVLKRITFEIIKNNFYKGWEKAEQQLGRNFVPDQDAIDFIQKYTFDNVKGLTEDIRDDLRQELSRGLMEGEGVTKLKTRIKKVFDKADNRAEMIARTETNRAFNKGNLLAYKQAGVKGTKVWISKIDHRTSPLCKRLDGQEVDLNDDFKDPKGEWSGQSPPSHVNCRSSFAFRPE